jgi:crotonobetainyl-CoA:carnitine CoA-transferase CaiB-like acyl-CoA transferase
MIPLLAGLRIIDLTAVILGPYATQILGDFGADVIKIEPPAGDSMRPIAPVAEPGISAIFANSNRNKRSVVLDLKTPAGKTAMTKLLAGADVLVHNMRQDALDKLGFGYDAVREIAPKIVYAAAVGFGSKGPYAGQPAYDDVIQGASGFAGLFAMRDGTPAYTPTIVADKTVGLHLVYAVLAAVLYRERTGKVPGYVEVPMFEAMAAFSLAEHLAWATFETDGKVGYPRVLASDRRPYATKDGWVAVLPYSQENWTKVLGEIGKPEVSREAWFLDATERSAKVGILYGYLAEALVEKPNAYWLELFSRLDIPHSPVRSTQSMLTDPHLEAVGMFETNFSGPTPAIRTLRQAVTVEKMTKYKDRPTSKLGADTEAVLREVGCTEAEIAACIAKPKAAEKPKSTAKPKSPRST